MTTVQQLAIDAEIDDLRKNADLQGWKFTRTGEDEFVFGVPARDETWLYLQVQIDRYPTVPPAWHWFDPQTGAVDGRAHTPVGGNFFHGNGVICAPWNRLAYQIVDPRGPHGDWSIEGDWKTNSKTGGTTTLSAMALRIALEAQTKYERRLGN